MATDSVAEFQRARRESHGRVLVIDCRAALSQALARQLARRPPDRLSDMSESEREIVCCSGPDGLSGLQAEDIVVFSPLTVNRRLLTPDVNYASSMLAACRQAQTRELVLISSAEIYGADYRHPGMIAEVAQVNRRVHNRLSAAWLAIEAMATEQLGDHPCRLSIVRPCSVLSGDRREFASRLFRARLAVRCAGYDPSIQLLSVQDFASAVASVVSRGRSGVYHVAPRQAMPLRKAMQVAGLWTFPVPYAIQRVVRALLAPLGLAAPPEQIDFLRYPWTVSGQKLSDELGVAVTHSSLEALAGHCQAEIRAAVNRAEVRHKRAGNPGLSSQAVRDWNVPGDNFGLDEQYIRSCSRWQLGFMEKFYWRIEVDGLDKIPRQGGAVLAGIHRGFMPLDGVMLVHLLSKYVGRVPRFLIHPGLVKYPYLSAFLSRLGGVIACQENADRFLSRQDILGIFPEGIRGAFRMYGRDIYKLGKQRDDYIRAALRHRVPIVPFVAVGPAETFPILARIESSWWKRHTHWPFIPVTPTANLVPLPTKWHIRILDPIPTNVFPQGADVDPSLIGELSRRVEASMQAAIDAMLRRRRSVFWGSVFDPAHTERAASNGSSHRLEGPACEAANDPGIA